MANLTNIPAIDWFETTLASSWNGTVWTVSVLDVPSGTIESGETSYIVVNPWKSNMQVAKIDGWDSWTKTFNVTDISVEKWNGVDYTAQSHAANSVVRFSNNYAFWKDIRTAVNSKAWTDTSNTWTWTQTFDKVITTGYTKDAIYADDTARDTAIPSPSNWMRVYNIAVWLFQKYQAGAWIDDTSWASTPNASTTVAGKVELATLAERQAGTATGWTGATLVPTNDALTTTSAWVGSAGRIPLLNASGLIDNTMLPSAVQSNIASNFTIWEVITWPRLLRYWISLAGQTISQLTESQNQRFPFSASEYWLWQSFISTTGWSLTSILVRMRKAGSPTGNINMRIRTASWWGTVIATSSTTISAATLATSYANQTFTFASEFIDINTTYFIELYSTVSQSWINFIEVASDINSYAGWQSFTVSDVNVWTAVPAIDIYMSIVIWAYSENTARLYIARSSYNSFANIVAWIQWNSTAWTTELCTLAWRIWWFSWLTPWAVYFLTDAWWISTTPWTVSTKVWRAISATEINFIPL